ncbi:MAG: chorismate synthase [Opitutales bacterium]|nr:chorismate synthase [Opitutales bacterium]
MAQLVIDYADGRRQVVASDERWLGADGKPTTLTNNAGGVLGGITTSRPVDFRAAFKPTATIAREQPTLDRDLGAATVVGRGRHDPCVLPRAVPIVEAMAALVCADAVLAQRAARI